MQTVIIRRSIHLPRSQWERFFILIAIILCFLPIPKLIPLLHGGTIGIFLAIVSFPMAVPHLFEKSRSRWCYISILIISIFKGLLSRDHDLALFSCIFSSLGPMFTFIAFIRTQEDIDSTLDNIVWIIMISVSFAILLYSIGGPFVKLRTFLIPDNYQYVDYDDNLLLSVVHGSAGLRGSVYMFGYDLCFLVAFLIGNLVYLFRNKHINFWQLLKVSTLFFFALLSININGQRMNLVIISVLTILAFLLCKAKLRFFIFIFAITGAMLVIWLNHFGDSYGLQSRLNNANIQGATNLRIKLINSGLSALEQKPFNPQDVYDSLAPTSFGKPLPPHVHFLTVIVQNGILVIPLVCYVLWNLGKSIFICIVHYLYHRSMIMLTFAMIASLIYGLTHNPGPWLLSPSAVLILSLYARCLDLHIKKNNYTFQIHRRNLTKMKPSAS